MGVQNFEVQFFSGFQKKLIFLGMKILWIFLGGHHKIRLYLGVISMHFWVFFKVNVQNGGILGGCLNFKYFWGFLKFLFFFFILGGGGGVNGRCWARAKV